MAVVEELIAEGRDGSLDFGNYELSEMTKLSDFPSGGSLYKVKTFSEMTKLEKDEGFAYESEPGTAVRGFRMSEEEIVMTVEGPEDAQITVAGAPDANYALYVDGKMSDIIKTTLGGKLSFSVVLEKGRETAVRIVRQ